MAAATPELAPLFLIGNSMNIGNNILGRIAEQK
jgi:hypothetical protein